MAKRSLGLIPERKEVIELSKHYGKIGDEIRKTCMDFILGEYTEIGAMKVRQRVDSLVHKLNVYASRWSREAVRQAYKDGLKVGIIRMDILGLKPNKLFNKSIHTKTIEIFASDTFDVFIKSNASIMTNLEALILAMKNAQERLLEFQAWDMRNEQVISNLLDDLIMEGQSRQAARKKILEHFANIMGSGNFININGRNYDLKKYSKMVARTRLRRTQSEAAVNLAHQYETDLVEISSHGTTCASNICQEYEGNVYSLEGKTPGYPTLPEYPPFHPNCEHSMFPTSQEALAFR